MHKKLRATVRLYRLCMRCVMAMGGWLLAKGQGKEPSLAVDSPPLRRHRCQRARREGFTKLQFDDSPEAHGQGSRSGAWQRHGWAACTQVNLKQK